MAFEQCYGPSMKRPRVIYIGVNSIEMVHKGGARGREKAIVSVIYADQTSCENRKDLVINSVHSPPNGEFLDYVLDENHPCVPSSNQWWI